MQQAGGQAEVLKKRAARRSAAVFTSTRSALVAGLLAFVVGCASVPPEPLPTPEPGPVETEPAPAVEPMPEPAPPAEPIPAEEPKKPFTAKVAIVLSDRSAAFESVAKEVASQLREPLLYNLADKSLSPQAAFAGINDSGAEVVIAIGLRAADAARSFSAVPIVYCQVFNFDSDEEMNIPVKGVSSMPPLNLQVQAWKETDPDLHSIGAIVGEGHDGLIKEAEEAAADHGVAFHYRITQSDRETLYWFRRLAPAIDGFWLFPDNRVLSVPVLREMLAAARRHDVRVAVFSDTLLGLGAAISTSSVDTDIATQVLSVAERMVDGKIEEIPDLTPLKEFRLRIGAPEDGRLDTLASGEEDKVGKRL